MSANAEAMTVPQIPKVLDWQLILLRTLKFSFFLLLVLFSVAAMNAVDFSLERLWEGRIHMADFLGRMFPPDRSILPRVLEDTLLTVQLAWVATVIAAVISLPIGFLAASNIVKFQPIRQLTLLLLSADRAIDSLILALFFVSAVGLGPFPGTLALAIHSVGMLGKLFADAIEAVDKGPIEALESAGAGRILTIRWAVMPQVIAHFISIFLFRFELNVRVAVVLGLVGAGGIGYLLNMYMRLFQYEKACTVILVIFVLVMCVDIVSAKLRKAVL